MVYLYTTTRLRLHFEQCIIHIAIYRWALVLCYLVSAYESLLLTNYFVKDCALGNAEKKRSFSRTYTVIWDSQVTVSSYI